MSCSSLQRTALRCRRRCCLTRQNSITRHGRRTTCRTTIRSPMRGLASASHGWWTSLDSYCAAREDAGAGWAGGTGVGSIAVARPSDCLTGADGACRTGCNGFDCGDRCYESRCAIRIRGYDCGYIWRCCGRVWWESRR